MRHGQVQKFPEGGVAAIRGQLSEIKGKVMAQRGRLLSFQINCRMYIDTLGVQ